jgi:hypothetical protein
VEASFVCTELDQLRWLAGKGYNFFGLWIHGVQYAKKDGATLHGRFLPVLFENLTDPIITGREEIGMPKLYADINVVRKGTTTDFSCSWGGREFVNIVMDGLQNTASRDPITNNIAADKAQSRKEDGLFVHRYVPAVGKPGETDAEYTVFIEDGLATTSQTVERTLRASSSQIKIDAGDWENLPTLHHIASWLAEMPIFSIVEAKTEEAYGIADLSQARRID